MNTVQQGTAKIVCDSTCSSASTTFDPGGRPLVVKIGGTTDNDTYVYDPITGRMTSYAFTVGSSPKVITGALTWNQNGTLRQLAITDTFNSGGAQTCNFGTSTVMGYDDLGRLLNANCGSVWAQTFSYDQFGNISKTGSLTWACPACYNANNQYNSTLSTAVSYDTDGNLLDDTFHKYTWDVYGHPSTIGGATGTLTCGTSGTCLTYDATGRMVEKNVSGVFTEILHSPVGKTATMSGQSTTSAYFPLPAGETLFETGSTGGNQFFWHKDWLGTVRFESNIGSRASVFDRAFAPFGEMYNNIGQTTPLSFTGDTQDTISGLFDTPNRELHPNQGRWLSPDPAGVRAVDLTNPQTWNRYAYVLNNPLSAIDPSGLWMIWMEWEGGGGFFDSDTLIAAGFIIQFDSNTGDITSIEPPSSPVSIVDANGNQIVSIGPDTEIAAGIVELQQSVTVSAAGSGVETISTVTGNFVLLSGAAGGPMSPSARAMLRAIVNAAPTVCGGGAFAYAGREVSAGPVHGFAGAITEFDSQSGTTTGALFEAGGGEGIEGGAGVVVAPNGNGTLGSEGLVFGGAGVSTPIASASAGVVGFPGGAGLYAQGALFGRAGGVGVYANVTTNAGCKKHR